jgi:hypothetical protein
MMPSACVTIGPAGPRFVVDLADKWVNPRKPEIRHVKHDIEFTYGPIHVTVKRCKSCHRARRIGGKGGVGIAVFGHVDPFVLAEVFDALCAIEHTGTKLYPPSLYKLAVGRALKRMIKEAGA